MNQRTREILYWIAISVGIFASAVLIYGIIISLT